MIGVVDAIVQAHVEAMKMVADMLGVPFSVINAVFVIVGVRFLRTRYQITHSDVASLGENTQSTASESKNEPDIEDLKQQYVDGELDIIEFEQELEGVDQTELKNDDLLTEEAVV